MSLTVTNQQIADAFGYPMLTEGALNRLRASQKTTALVSNMVRKATRIAAGALSDLHEARTALIETCAKKDEAGANVPDGRGGTELAEPDRFVAEYNDLMAKSVTLEGVEPIPFGKIAHLDISGDDLDALEPFLSDVP